MLDGLFTRIEDQRDALVELTRELVRFPTVNPPGEAYRPCARHLGNRLNRAGFDVSYIREQVYLNPHPKELMLRNHV